MRTLRRFLGGPATAVTCLVLLLTMPATARAQGHGAGIQKGCVGPAVADPNPNDGIAKARIGDVVDCVIIISNADTLLHDVRIERVEDCVLHQSGTECRSTSDMVNPLMCDAPLPVTLGPGSPPLNCLSSHTVVATDVTPLIDTATATFLDLGTNQRDMRSQNGRTDLVCVTDADCSDCGQCVNSVCVPAPSTRICRAKAGECDVEERCTGTSRMCPADGVEGSSVVCRASACDEADPTCCDVAERCDGVNKTCPADAFAPTTKVCRPQTGNCDTEERCTGGSAICPADAVQGTTTVCRASVCNEADPTCCDVTERCDGVNKICPADAFAATTKVCRPQTGDCDTEERCTGGSAICPADAVQGTTTVCRASICNEADPTCCDVAERCDGVNKACPADAFAPTTKVCRAKIGECDREERCTGTAGTCPADAVEPTTVVCRSKMGDCDVPDRCDGVNKTCPADALEPSTTICRQAAGACDDPERCTGNGKTCPADAFKLLSTACELDGDVCTLDHCDGFGACVFLRDNPDTLLCPTCGDTLTPGNCVATLTNPGDPTPHPYGSLQAAVDAAVKTGGAHIHIAGVCQGITLIDGFTGLTIEGDPAVDPTTQLSICPPGLRTLTSTLQGDATATPRLGSKGEVIKVINSSDIVVRYLNIVNGGDHDGLEYKNTSHSTAFCNCVAKNDEGYELDFPGAHSAQSSLVTKNIGAGIQLRRGQTGTIVENNVVRANTGDGIAVVEGSKRNIVRDNRTEANGLSGIHLNNGDVNMIERNIVMGNVTAGITLENGSNGNNPISDNTIEGNGDGLVGLIRCVGDLSSNVGNNAPMTPACR